MKKIAFIADALDNQYAGIRTYTYEIIKALLKIDSKNQYLIIREQKGNFQHFQNAKEIVLPTKFNNILPYKMYRLLVEIPMVLRKEKVDIVIEPRHFGPFNLPKSIKRITIIHDLTPLLFPQWHTFFGYSLQKMFLPYILKKGDHIITNSYYTQQDVYKVFPFTKSKSTAIPLGKDKQFKPTVNKEILTAYGIHQPYLLYVGTLEPRKNLETLLSAFELLQERNNRKYQLVLVGKRGWKIDAFFEKLAKSLFRKDIRLTNYVPFEHLPILYSMATVFVYPSLYEGFGLPILEAMSCGTPVITSKVSSMPEVGGDAAIYFNPTSSDDLFKKLMMLLNDESLLQQKRKQGLLQAQRFSWEKAARKMIEVFDE